jgi:hypothetical protein
MSTSTLIAQLRIALQLTNTEIQIAETRVVQARTEAVRRELTQNAANGRERAAAIEEALRGLGGLPELVAPFLGRTLAAVKTVAEQAQPFDEALLGDLALEQQLLGRAKYIKALATAADEPTVVALASRLVTAHSATADPQRCVVLRSRPPQAPRSRSSTHRQPGRLADSTAHWTQLAPPRTASQRFWAAALTPVTWLSGL